jgi:hypothetical protein
MRILPTYLTQDELTRFFAAIESLRKRLERVEKKVGMVK